MCSALSHIFFQWVSSSAEGGSCYAQQVGPSALARQIVLAFAWSFSCVLVLSVVDSVARSPGSSGGSLLFLVLGVLSALLALAVLKLAGLSAARAVSWGSLVAVAALLPCMARLADSPLVLDLVGERPRLYSGLALLAIGASTFGLTLGLQRRFEAQTTPLGAHAPPGPDHRLIGIVAALGLLSVPLVATSARLPTPHDLAAVQPYAEMTVPALDAVDGDSIPIFDDGAVAVSASRTHPLPLKIARLEVDLGDGVGARPTLPVGGGERLRLVHRAQLVWELCHVPPSENTRTVPSQRREPCVMLARFVKGAASAPADPRVSNVRGKVAPPGGFLFLAGVAFVGAAVALVITELRRRKLLRVMRGQAGLRHPDGVIESLGEHYTLRVPPQHGWPGPVVLLDVDESASPYRGTRTAGSVVPGTIEQHLGWYAQQRVALHQVITVAYALAIAHLAAAGLVGYWGF